MRLNVQFTIAAAIAVGFLGATVPAPASSGGPIPDFVPWRASLLSSEGRLFDRDGELLQERRLRLDGRFLGWVRLADVSPSVREAVLFVEDRRFYEHGGLDWRAMAGAAWQNLFQGTRRGASTISMQTVGFLDPALQAQRGRGRTWWLKLRQARLAWELEEKWQKDEILEAYLNLVTFRGELRGLLAAARGLFGKDPHGLTEREAHLLAVLLKAPGARVDSVGERLCLWAKEKPSLGECASLRGFARETLSRTAHPKRAAELAPHLARRLLSTERPEVRSTVRAGLQLAVTEAVEEQMRALASQNMRDAAVVVVENSTGYVLAYLGSSGHWSASPQVDMTESLRQAGSTLKPFLYALAFETNLLEPRSWLLDEPFELFTGRGSYRPENYDHSFLGPVPAATALGASLNIPAVRVLDLVGVESFRDRLVRLGFRDLQDAEFYGPSLALGSADVRLLDLVAAYRALAREGVWSPLRFTPGAPTRDVRVFSRKSAEAVTAILSDRDSRAPTFGFDNLLATTYPAAVKTGTSKDMRDNWCLGFTRDYTVGVWVGNSGGEPMHQVSGVAGAAPIWRRVMDHLPRKNAKASKLWPALQAEAPEFVRASFGKILYPNDGEVLAIDPDVPAGRQLVPLEADGAGEFRVDGEEVREASWAPRPGRHRIALHGADGKLLDEISVVVR